MRKRKKRFTRIDFDFFQNYELIQIELPENNLDVINIDNNFNNFINLNKKNKKL